MTRFEDGPARGQVLMLKRAARFLRVTLSAGGKWDALDQLGDSPRPDENVFVYEIVGKPGHAFIDGGKARGLYPIASYRIVTVQPTERTVRDNKFWAEWCEAAARANPREDL